jgi:hypothetical protein
MDVERLPLINESTWDSVPWNTNTQDSEVVEISTTERSPQSITRIRRYIYRIIGASYIDQFLCINSGYGLLLAICMAITLGSNYKHYVDICFIWIAIKAVLLFVGYFCCYMARHHGVKFVYNLAYLIIFITGLGISVYIVNDGIGDISLMRAIVILDSCLNLFRLIYYSCLFRQTDPRAISGMSQRSGIDIAALNKFDFEAEAEADIGIPPREASKHDTCVICLDNYQTNGKCILLCCKHYFHEDCITPWLERVGYNCPICRADGSA